MVFAWVAGLLLVTAGPASAATYINAFAGNLIPNGTATNIGVGASGVTTDASGNVYFCDSSNHTIRKITIATGILTVIAGTGRSGFSGDGGAATSAQLNSPKGIARDSSGNFYIADTSNHRIRKIDAVTGNISTIAGTGTGTFGGDGAAATAARVNSPQGVAVDSSGNVYIADTSNNRIRKIDAGTGNISTVAGNGTGGYLSDNVAATGTRINAPRGVVVDGAGNFYIADTSNNRIRKVDTGGTITTYAGTGTASFSGDNGAATSATIRAPQALTLDSTGNMYIADTTNHRVRKISGGIITTLSGTGSAGYGGDNGIATSGQLSSPAGIAVDSSGNVYIGDTGNLRLRKISSGNITTAAGTGSAFYGGDGGAATNAQFTSPQAMAFDTAGNMYLSDSGTHRIRKMDTSGNVTTIAGTGVAGYSGDNGPATSARMNTPLGIAIDSSNNLYIADGNNNRVRKVDIATGVITTFAGDGTGSFGGDNGPATSAQLFGPFGVALFGTALYITDTGNNRVRKVDAGGTITTVAGDGTASYGGDNGLATSAQLNTPIGIAFDGAGNMFVTDYSNGAIRKIASGTGIITTVAGTGANGYGGDNGPATSAQLNSPRAVAVDSSGNILITDTTNSRIRKVTAATGIITTLAGDGTAAFSGDGGDPALAQVSTPQSIMIGSDGTIYFGDTGNRRFRKIFVATVPGVPTGVSATAGDRIATVTFAAPASDGGAPITGYTVTSSPAGGVDDNAGSTSLTHAVTGLTNGISYTFTVTANNLAGTGAASDPSGGVVPHTVPDAPAIGTATAGDASASVSFTPPLDNGGEAIDSYRATCSGGLSATGTAPPITVPGLTNGSAYTCTVAAHNSAGWGNESGASNSVTPKANQLLIFSAAPTVVVGGTGTATLSAWGASGNPVVWSSLTASQCAVNAATGVVSGLHAGTNNCTIQADQAANPAFNAGVNTQSISIGKANQILTFNSAPTVMVGRTGTVSLNAWGASGNPITFSSTTIAECTVNDVTGVVTGVHAGTNNCTIQANQAENADYHAGTATLVLSVQAPVTSYSALSPTGSGTITATLSGATAGPGCGFDFAEFIPLSGHANSPPPNLLSADVSFPHGLFNFTLVGCTPGGTVTLTVSYPQPLPVRTAYFKYGPTQENPAPHWYVLPNAVFNGNTATFSITDGGLGDDDYLQGMNGTIADQGGPGGLPPPAQIPALSREGMVLLAIILGGLALMSRPRRKKRDGMR